MRGKIRFLSIIVLCTFVSAISFLAFKIITSTKTSEVIGRNVIIPNDMRFYHLGEIRNYPSQKKNKILMIHNSSDSR